VHVDGGVNWVVSGPWFVRYASEVGSVDWTWRTWRKRVRMSTQGEWVRRRSMANKRSRRDGQYRRASKNKAATGTKSQRHFQTLGSTRQKIQISRIRLKIVSTPFVAA
jgi:hypothetical protein